MMKSIELTAYAVREYDVKYTVVLDETDPIIQKFLADHNMTIDELGASYEEHQEIWDEIMYSQLDIDIQEDFGMADERLVDFESFVSEN
jgi:hypothetical protein